MSAHCIEYGTINYSPGGLYHFDSNQHCRSVPAAPHFLQPPAWSVIVTVASLIASWLYFKVYLMCLSLFEVIPYIPFEEASVQVFCCFLNRIFFPIGVLTTLSISWVGVLACVWDLQIFSFPNFSLLFFFLAAEAEQSKGEWFRWEDTTFLHLSSMCSGSLRQCAEMSVQGDIMRKQACLILNSAFLILVWGLRALGP